MNLQSQNQILINQNDIEKSIWKLYKHFPRSIIDNLNNEQISKFILDNLDNLDISFVNNEEILQKVSEKIKAIKNYKLQLDILNSQPKVDQRTDEWYRLRQERLTGSDTAQALGRGKYGNRNALIKKKATESNNSSGFGANVPALRHGVMFESMALRCYTQRLSDIIVHDFGLIPHPTLNCYGASPDGINDIGIMIEIKCPYSRAINGTIPEQYKLQMLGQMAVCSLKECDYIECDITEFNNIEDYLNSILNTENIDHGVVFEIKDNTNKIKYIYSPEYKTISDILIWINEQTILYNDKIKKICPWKLNKIDIQRVSYDDNLWNEIVPEIKKFWEEVLLARKNVQKKYAILEDDD